MSRNSSRVRVNTKSSIALAVRAGLGALAPPPPLGAVEGLAGDEPVVARQHLLAHPPWPVPNWGSAMSRPGMLMLLPSAMSRMPIRSMASDTAFLIWLLNRRRKRARLTELLFLLS